MLVDNCIKAVGKRKPQDKLPWGVSKTTVHYLRMAERLARRKRLIDFAEESISS